MNDYREYISGLVKLVNEAKKYPLGGGASVLASQNTLATYGSSVASPHQPPAEAPKTLIFSPHPDDECVIGALAIRLMREVGMSIINVAVTLGSKPERQAERLAELKAACNYLGFGLVQTAQGGLEGVSVKSRDQNPMQWVNSVKIIVQILTDHQPRVIFLPHEHDWNSSHIGTHFLVIEALESMPGDFECFVVETEYWGQMDDPNLMVEMSAADLSDMINALTFHVGEVKRNPYHLFVPVWMMDNVRRGAELVGGQGGTAPDFTFATLYRLRRWRGGKLEKTFDGGRHLSKTENAGILFQ